ncbi:hypothetical protein B566_EDAN012496 [Ephemera danica]|nr:hypothetical protein B566_EDAN012496 [Ephemera danica]
MLRLAHEPGEHHHHGLRARRLRGELQRDCSARLGNNPDICPEGEKGKPDIPEFFRDKTVCQRKEIEEVLYPCNADPERMIQCAEWMENSWMDAMAPFMVRIQNRVTQAAWRLEHFTTNTWQVTSDNVYRLLDLMSPKDAVTFNFDLRNIDWEDYTYQYAHGDAYCTWTNELPEAERARIVTR